MSPRTLTRRFRAAVGHAAGRVAPPRAPAAGAAAAGADGRPDRGGRAPRRLRRARSRCARSSRSRLQTSPRAYRQTFRASPVAAQRHARVLGRRQQCAQVVERVRLGRVLVRPVALHAREAERDAARVALRGVHAVERDLDHQLGADEDRDPTLADLARQQLLGLPLEQLVRQPLEATSRPSRTRPSRHRARRGGGSRASPRRRPWPHSAPSTTRSYVRTGLTFRHALPRRPAAYSDDASFTTTPSCPAASASSRTRCPRPASDVMTLGTFSAGATASSRSAALLERDVEQVLAVEVEHVERKVRALPRRARAPRRRAPPARRAAASAASTVRGNGAA